ncbi:MAG: glycosyltransferase [Janthinobacterium lividum]
MATCNGSEYILEQLDSLANQIVLPAELVVTDDASDDDTVSIVRRFATTATFPVRIYRNHERLGYRANFMKAASLCSSPLIAFCDQDDIWYPNKLEQAVEVFADPQVVMLYHEARIVRDGVVLDEKLRKIRDPQPYTDARRGQPWSFPLGFTIIFRASLRRFDALWSSSQDFKEPHQRDSHDEWYYFLASVLGTTVYISEPLADYRQHRNNFYGITVRPKQLIDRLGHLLENRSSVYTRLAEAARNRSALLRIGSSQAGLDDIARQNLTIGADAWQQLAVLYEYRTRLYLRSLGDRTKALVDLVVARAYGRRGYWTFGRRALAKDALFGVVLARAVRRYGRPGTGSDWRCSAGDGSARKALRITPRNRVGTSPS